MADVFISYAREDRQWVEKLASQLQAEGFSVWWDWDLLVGKRYRETIDAELQACKAAVVVWSQYSVRSDFVRDEAEEAQQRNVLLPVLKEVVRPPAGFRQIQSADLSTWVGDLKHEEFRRVMKGVAHMVGRPAGGDVPDAPVHPATPADEPPAASAKPIDSPAATAPVAPLATQPKLQPVRQSNQVLAPATIAARPSLPFKFRLPALPLSSLPPRTHPIWRYLAIGTVALLAVLYVAAQFSSPPSNTTGKSASGGSNAVGGSNAAGGTNGAGTQTGAETSTGGAPPTGQATDTSGLSGNVATAVQKAETSDKSARARAALAAEQGTLADAASARARQGEGSSVGLLSGRDGSGNTFTFAGETSDGTEQGVGAAALSNGGRYSGQWFGGIAQGLGVYTYSNGDQYSGEFDENLESGLGAVTFTDHSKGLGYSGQWAANAYNGYGVYYFQDGTRLEGLWHAGQLNGPGARFGPSGKLLEQGTYANSVLKR